MSDTFESGFTFILGLADSLSLDKDYYEEFINILDALGIYTEEPLSELYDPVAKRFTNLTIDALWAVFKAGKINEIVARVATNNPPALTQATCTHCSGTYDVSMITAPVSRRSKILPNALFCTPNCLMEYHEKVQPAVAEALFELIDIASDHPEKDIREYIMSDLLMCGTIDEAMAKKGMTVLNLSKEYFNLIK